MIQNDFFELLQAFAALFLKIIIDWQKTSLSKIQHYTRYINFFTSMMKFCIFAAFVVIANASLTDLADKGLKAAGTSAICEKQCATINKQIKKQFEKKCPEAVCKNEKVKENLMKSIDAKIEKMTTKLGCQKPCISFFEAVSEEEEDHGHAHDDEPASSAGYLTGSIVTILMARLL